MEKRNPDISVVIPCFNTPVEFIKEAIESVKANKEEISYEIIIVDDGSTDEATLQFLKQINNESINVIFQTNKGPAVARNTGVQNSRSNYIFFLDSDDKLNTSNVYKAFQILKNDANTGVVYSNATLFGDASRNNFISKPFDITELLINNYIPMCSLINKSAWEDVGGLDEALIQYEDWEFWIHIYKAGWKFEFIDKPMFDYRIRKESLISQQPQENFKKAVAYIYKKHWDLIYEVYHQLYANRIMYRNDIKRPLRSFIKFSKKKFLN